MNHFKGEQKDTDIIMMAVGYKLRYGMSYRELVEVVNDRFHEKISHTTIMRWVHEYAPIFEKKWRKYRQSYGKTWRMDETYIKVKGKWWYQYRAIDSTGWTLDYQLRKHRDKQAAYQFFKRLFKDFGEPRVLVTDKYSSTTAALKQLRKEEMYKSTIHCQSKYRNNMIEQDHRLLKKRLSCCTGFQSSSTAKVTLKGYEAMHGIYKEERKQLVVPVFSAFKIMKEYLDVA